jgi:hypothetical protein
MFGSNDYHCYFEINPALFPRDSLIGRGPCLKKRKLLVRIPLFHSLVWTCKKKKKRN